MCMTMNEPLYFWVFSRSFRSIPLAAVLVRPARPMASKFAFMITAPSDISFDLAPSQTRPSSPLQTLCPL